MKESSALFPIYSCERGGSERDSLIRSLLVELESLAHRDASVLRYVSFSGALLYLSEDYAHSLKQVIFYGLTCGLKQANAGVLLRTISYIQQLLACSDISPSDRLSAYTALASAYVSLHAITNVTEYLCKVVSCFSYIKELVENDAPLACRLGWTHFQLGGDREELSQVRTARHYQEIGDALLNLFALSKETQDLFLAQESLARACYFMPHNPQILVRYGEALQAIGLRLGRSSYIKQAKELFARAIFLSFDRKEESRQYKYSRCLYALAAVALFDVTLDQKHFAEAVDLLYQTLQEYPRENALWLSWGSLLLRYGWMYKDARYIEAGLDKLSSIKEGPGILSGWFAHGLSILGLYLEEVSLLKGSRSRLVAVIRSFPGNAGLVYALGVTLLCSGLYFRDNYDYAAAVSCFQACIELDPENIDVQQKLFDAYFAWGVEKKSIRTLQKARRVIHHLCNLRPEGAFLWWNYGLVLMQLAEYTLNTTYKELFLEKAQTFFQQASDLGLQGMSLEPWAKAHFLLAELAQDLYYYDAAYDVLTTVPVRSLSFKESLLLAAILFGKGRILQETQWLQKALEILNPLLSTNNESEELLLLLGKIWSFVFFMRRNIRAKQTAGLYLKSAAALGNQEARAIWFRLSEE